MSKRNFGFDTSSLATAPSLLEDGVYTGIMSGASISGKENKQFINIVEETKWDKNEKVQKLTGDWIIEGSIFYGVTLNDQRAIDTLQRDEPKVFGGRIRLAFDKETLALLPNFVLGAWLEALGLLEIDFSEGVDWEYDENIDIPMELADVPNIVDMLNSLEYQRAMFSTICQAANNTPVRVKVVKQANYKNKDVFENSIDTGSYNSFCGILPVEA